MNPLTPGDHLRAAIASLRAAGVPDDTLAEIESIAVEAIPVECDRCHEMHGPKTCGHCCGVGRRVLEFGEMCDRCWDDEPRRGQWSRSRAPLFRVTT